MADIGEHYSPTTASYPSGTYRVVGSADDVTLLRVADGDGRRRYTGELLHVAPGTLAESFEHATDPDAGIRPVASVRNALQGLYWSVRRLVPP